MPRSNINQNSAGQINKQKQKRKEKLRKGTHDSRQGFLVRLLNKSISL